TAPEGASWIGSDVATWLIGFETPFHVAFFQCVENQFGVFDKLVAPFVLVETKSFVFNPGQSTAKAENKSAVREVVKQRDLLSDADWVVPWQHDNHRSQFHMLGSARHVREELQNIWTHRIICKMVLDRPHRVKAKRLGQLSESTLLLVNLSIRAGI